jgi:hypothetical protein
MSIKTIFENNGTNFIKIDKGAYSIGADEKAVLAIGVSSRDGELKPEYLLNSCPKHAVDVNVINFLLLPRSIANSLKIQVTRPRPSATAGDGRGRGGGSRSPA